MNNIRFNEAFMILCICISTAVFIVIYGTFRCKGMFKDPLKYSFAQEPWDKFLDGWGICHLLFYMALGLYFPNHFIFISLLGIIWEFIETIFKSHPMYIMECNIDISTENEGIPIWWYGRWQDIIMNTIGLIIGINISKIL